MANEDTKLTGEKMEKNKKRLAEKASKELNQKVGFLKTTKSVVAYDNGVIVYW